MWGIDRLWTREELINLEVIRNIFGIFYHFRRRAGKFGPTLPAMLVGNGTVPISVWRGGGVRFYECRL